MIARTPGRSSSTCGPWRRWSTCGSPRASASKAPTAAGIARGGRAAPASSSTTASTPSGEDLRRLDWKVLARTGRAYLRLYQDETNLVCTLAIDASGSMEFAGQSGRSKLEYVQYLATALATSSAGSRTRSAWPSSPRSWRPSCRRPARRRTWPGSTKRSNASRPRPATHLAAGLRDLFQRFDAPRRADADERFPGRRPGGSLRRRPPVSPPAVGSGAAAPDPSGRGAAAGRRGLSASRAWRTTAASMPRRRRFAPCISSVSTRTSPWCERWRWPPAATTAGCRRPCRTCRRSAGSWWNARGSRLTRRASRRQPDVGRRIAGTCHVGLTPRRSPKQGICSLQSPLIITARTAIINQAHPSS